MADEANATDPRTLPTIDVEAGPEVLSEEFQLDPEQSTDAIVVHHPDASYFNAK